MGKKVIIVGAGAAGLAASVFAARKGASVTVLEGMERPGKKLLLTGNGRCNLTNTDPELPKHYHGTGASMAKAVTECFSASDTIDFFSEIGLMTFDKNGYVYPCTSQSSSVLSVLMQELERLKVKMKYTEKVESVRKENGRWLVKTNSWQYEADAVILACGSKSLPATGSDGSGYALASKLGHTVITPSPALTSVVCRGDFFAGLSGVRCRATVSLYDKSNEKDQLLGRESGELQWTKYGVSGIVVFQLSRFVAVSDNPKKLYLKIDLVPDCGFGELKEKLLKLASGRENQKVSSLFAGILHEKLIPVVLKMAGVSAKITCRDMDPGMAETLTDTVKGLNLSVAGTKSFDSCQVCAGGIDCREVCPETMESEKHRGLFFCGEILDVDGPCGGYNLQWAWSSGYTAGVSAAQYDL